MLTRIFLSSILALLFPYEFSLATDVQSGTGRIAKSPPGEMMLIPAGKGVTRWGGQIFRKLIFDRPFYVDKFEVTVEEYDKYLSPKGKVQKRDLTPAYFEQAELPKHAKYPVVGVTWRQAELYCKAMGKRLPANVEWMMAAVRKGDETAGPGGVALFDLDELGKSQSSMKVEIRKPFHVYDQGLRPVGSFLDDVSTYGVYDMASSVSEWLDWTDKKHDTRELIGRFSKSLGPAFHSLTHVEDHGGRFWLGFRCAKDVPK
ncbi:MAG TPA: hypothetical protein DD706_16120 [Nitrospiraceae bacterium]|nr:hypothetical protein [Nitrospiraceae bacterium]